MPGGICLTDRENAEFHKQIEKLTCMLFNACMELERRGGFESWELGGELQKWFQDYKREMHEHQKQCKIKAEERKRELITQARAKLTLEELKALGLNKEDR